MQTIIYMLLTNYQSYLVRLEKKDYKSSQWKNESKTLQKIAHPFPEDFLAEIDVAFKKSYNILCAFEVLNVDNLNKLISLEQVFGSWSTFMGQNR